MLPQHSCRHRGRRLAVAFALLGLLGGCATVRSVDLANGTPDLEDYEGILVVQVVTDVPLASVDTSSSPVAVDLPKGRHLLVLAATEGTYYWQGFTRVVRGTTWVYRYSRERRNLPFTVVAGAINYAGMVIIREPDPVYDSGFRFRDDLGLNYRIVDRAASTLEELRRLHPQLLEEMPMRFAWTTGDPFLERYFEARRRAGGSPEGAGAEPGS